VQRVVVIVNVLVASILIIGAVVGLYKLRNQSDRIRLGSIAAFTALFSISLALLTNARRAEIFVATAAYTAVLVVFISGDLGNNGGGSVNGGQAQTH
jgi:O-antigen ligase